MGFLDIFFGSEETSENEEIWHQLETVEEFQEALDKSYSKTIVIFKHSTSCHISKIVKKKFEDDLQSNHPNPKGVEFYYLNLLHFRPISNLVANELNISHESPQILVVKNGDVVHHASHQHIDFQDVLKYIH